MTNEGRVFVYNTVKIPIPFKRPLKKLTLIYMIKFLFGFRVLTRNNKKIVEAYTKVDSFSNTDLRPLMSVRLAIAILLSYTAELVL